MKVTGGEFTASEQDDTPTVPHTVLRLQSSSNMQDVSEVEGACIQPDLHFNCVAFPKKSIRHVSRIYNKNWQDEQPGPQIEGSARAFLQTGHSC